jgi:hypothetical protein
VVLPSFLLGRVVGPAGWADNTATRLVATGSYQVTPLRSVPLAAAVASSRQVLSQAPGRWGQGSDPRQNRTMNRHGGHGRPTGPKPGITPVAYRVRPHRDHHRNHRSGVLGDVAGHLLGRQLPRLLVAGDVADVELLTPAGIAVRLTLDRWARHADSGHRLPDGALEDGGRDTLWRWGQTLRATARSWTAEDGSGRSVVEVVAEELGASLRWATATTTRTTRSQEQASTA